MEEIEIWKSLDFIGFPDYEVSNMGRVKSLKCGKERILKPSKTKVGYLDLNLCKNGKPKHFLVHRLVAKCFLEPIEGKDIINHKDENPLNNRVENLEFCSQQYNCNYGTHNEKLSKAKYIPIIQLDLQNNFIREWNSAKIASKELNISRHHISSCCRGRRNKCGDYKWVYKSDYKPTSTQLEINFQ